MTIDAIKSPYGSIGTIKPIRPQNEPAAGTQPAGKEESFKDMFTSALKEVDGLQKEADQKIAGVMLGNEGVSPHDAMIALEKADTVFQLMNNIRARIIRAYEDIMRTQV